MFLRIFRITPQAIGMAIAAIDQQEAKLQLEERSGQQLKIRFRQNPI
jgi:hypothetical protein